MIKIIATFWTSLALASITFAQAKPATPAAPAAPGMEMKTETGQATVLTGKVMDPKAGKLTIKTNDREVKLTTDSKGTDSEDHKSMDQSIGISSCAIFSTGCP